MIDPVALQLLTQGRTIQPQVQSCLRDIAAGAFHYNFEQGLFNFGQHEIVEAAGRVTIQLYEVTLERVFHVE